MNREPQTNKGDAMKITITMNIEDDTLGTQWPGELRRMLSSLIGDINSIEAGQSTKRYLTTTDSERVGTVQTTKRA